MQRGGFVFQNIRPPGGTTEDLCFHAEKGHDQRGGYTEGITVYLVCVCVCVVSVSICRVSCRGHSVCVCVCVRERVGVSIDGQANQEIPCGGRGRDSGG